MDMRDEHSSEELERGLARSLHAAAPVAAPDLADRLLRQTAAVEQRRGWFAWSSIVPALATAAALIVAVTVGLQVGGLFPPTGSAPSPSPGPSGSKSMSPATNTPAPTIAPSPSGAPASGTNRCENPELGYAVNYPSDWFANEAVERDEERDPVAACQHFSDEPIEMPLNTAWPPTVAMISFSLHAEELPPIGTTLSTEQVTVAGRPATVTESEGPYEGIFFTEGDFSYGYEIMLPDGRFLVALTFYAKEGDYEDYDAHKQVLDQMMETLVLIGS